MIVLFQKIVNAPEVVSIGLSSVPGPKFVPRLSSFIAGSWVPGCGEVSVLVNPSTGDPIAEITGGVDVYEAVQYARQVGGPALRAMTFKQRGELLRRIAKAVDDDKEELYKLSIRNGGNTRNDAKFDVNGAIGTLAYYAELAEKMVDTPYLLDGEAARVTKVILGQHVYVSREGVAVHINAFNFPTWGMMEKLACAILAGMPVISKPATATALVAHRIAAILVKEEILPKGAFQLLLGPGSEMGRLFNHLNGQDVVAFTGSRETGKLVRSHPRLIAENVHVNLELDSLNAAVLGPDIELDTPLYELFLSQVVHEMTQKAGGKCTATRRIFVPQNILPRVRTDLVERLKAIKVGNPADSSVTMGPLATPAQLEAARERLARLKGSGCSSCLVGVTGSTVVYDGTPKQPIGVPDGKQGNFLGPILLEQDDPFGHQETHTLEVFAPVATLMPYDGTTAQAIQLVRMGGGMLVGSFYSDDPEFLHEVVFGTAPYHGRIVIQSASEGKLLEPGNVVPQIIHGGPGAAGGGQELGGLQGVLAYMHRVGLEVDGKMLRRILVARSG